MVGPPRDTSLTDLPVMNANMTASHIAWIKHTAYTIIIIIAYCILLFSIQSSALYVRRTSK